MEHYVKMSIVNVKTHRQTESDKVNWAENVEEIRAQGEPYWVFAFE